MYLSGMGDLNVQQMQALSDRQRAAIARFLAFAKQSGVGQNDSDMLGHMTVIPATASDRLDAASSRLFVDPSNLAGGGPGRSTLILATPEQVNNVARNAGFTVDVISAAGGGYGFPTSDPRDGSWFERNKTTVVATAAVLALGALWWSYRKSA